MATVSSVRIMGILNATPDSFSDGGQFHSVSTALEQADKLIEAGADILDVGGESTRPYAAPVSTDEELSRVIPVIEGIRKKHSLPISIDTTKAVVARKALTAGADIINDVSALRKDPEMLHIVLESSAPVIIMHMQGTPSDMQDNPVYVDVVQHILDFFIERITWLKANGVDQDRIIIDPGIGFGKTVEHNLSILKHLQRLKSLGTQVLLGHSRKKFLGVLTGLDVQERDLPTAVISALSVREGVDIVRVHNAAATRQALQVAEAIQRAE